MVMSVIPPKIAPELTQFARPIADAKPHPDNARVHDLASIAKSLQQHGQRAAIVVQSSTGWIVKGNGTWTAAAQLLGWSELAQVWQDMTDEQALAFLLADNKASDGSSYDPGKLTSALGKMLDGPGLLDTLWTSAELEDYVEGAAPMTTLAPAESEAAYADPELKDRLEAQRAGARQMRLVQVTLTETEHAHFMGWLRKLRDSWGMSGWIGTIYEAVKRQSESEGEAPQVGRDLDAEALARARAAVAKEIRDIVIAAPGDDNSIRRSFLYGQLQPIINSGGGSAGVAVESDAVDRDGPHSVPVNPPNDAENRPVGQPPVNGSGDDAGAPSLVAADLTATAALETARESRDAEAAVTVAPDPPTPEGELFKYRRSPSFDIPAEAPSGSDH